ncbi:putative nucleotidyltransferase, ribonuclease H [Tanacetum coccineum]
MVTTRRNFDDDEWCCAGASGVVGGGNAIPHGIHVWNRELLKELKRKLVSAPILDSSIRFRGFQIYSDASKKVLGIESKPHATRSKKLKGTRDPKFMSRFWKGLQKAWGTRLKFSTAFHPQTDGQSERTIQTLEDMLRACALEWTGCWDEYLCLVEFAYNNKLHAASGMHFDFLSGRKMIGHLFAGMKGVKRFGIKGKLSPRFIGPFEILERIGEVSYRLALPPQLSHVHDVFHVSLLRGYHYHPLHVASYPFDQIQPDMSLSEEPESILDRQERVMRNKVIPFVKILWKNHPEREATWETEESMRASYPHFFV